MNIFYKIHSMLTYDLNLDKARDYKVKHFRVGLFVVVIGYLIWMIFADLFKNYMGHSFQIWSLFNSIFSALVLGLSFKSNVIKKRMELGALITFLLIAAHGSFCIAYNPDISSYWISNFMAFAACSIILVSRKTVLLYSSIVFTTHLGVALFGPSNNPIPLMFFTVSIIIYTVTVIGVLPGDLWLSKVLHKEKSAAEDLNRQQTLLISQICHDIKTPLVSLVALLPKIKSQVNNQKLEKMLGITINGVSQIHFLTTQLSSFQKILTRQIQPNLTDTNITSLINRCIEIVQSTKLGQSAQFQNLLKKEIFVISDRDMIEQVVINLLNNALKYNSQKTPLIRVTSAQKQNNLNIIIEDNGIGMNEEQMKQIFTPFYRADSSRTDRESYGLGLSICKEILLSHKSDITIKTSTPGAGTAIQFELPLVTQKEIKAS